MFSEGTSSLVEPWLESFEEAMREIAASLDEPGSDLKIWKGNIFLGFAFLASQDDNNPFPVAAPISDICQTSAISCAYSSSIQFLFLQPSDT